MKPSLRRAVPLNLVTYLFVTLLLVACGTAPVAKTTRTAQELAQDIIPSVTATPDLNIATGESTIIFTPTPSEILPSPSITPSPVTAPSPRPDPTFTPTSLPLDGWLVFESAREDTNGDGIINRLDDIHIYSLNLNTNELVQLTFGEYRNLHPNWSPDRKQIAFVSNQNGNYDLYIMNVDGSNIRQLTETPENETSPVWSSDGQQINYILVRTLEDGLEERHLYTVSINGEDNRRLINLPGNSFDPDLSPDGRFLIYTQMEPFTFEGEIRTGTVVYLLDMQSAQNFRITSSIFESNKGQFQNPKWLPREGWYLSMIQVPGDLNPSGMKVFELTWDGEKPLLRQVVEFGEGPGIYTWGPNGEWLISVNHRTVSTQSETSVMTTDLSAVPITVPRPQTQLQLDPAMQRSEHILLEEGDWLTNDIFYEGNLDWAP